MNKTIRDNEQFSEIKEYFVENACIGYYGYITRGFQNLKEIMPAEYKELPFTSIVKNYIIRSKIKIETPAISIINSWYLNFYHFIYESLVKVFCLRNHLGSATIVFPSVRHKFHDEWIELLGLTNLTIINKRQVVKTPLAISCNYLSDDMKSKNDILLEFKDWVLFSMKQKGLLYNKSRFPRKIFINRSNPKYRRILNINEVMPVMNKSGYTSIDLEDFTLAEQINYFYHAEDIIGVHGAGFAHMCFTKAPVLDIICENFYMGYFEKLSETFGLKYEYLRSKGVENDFPNKTSGYHDIIIDITRLKNHISQRNA